MSDTTQIMLRAYKAHVALPAFNIPYLPMMEPVTRAVTTRTLGLIMVARLEWVKFQAGSQAAIRAEFDGSATRPHATASGSRTGHRRGRPAR